MRPDLVGRDDRRIRCSPLLSVMKALAITFFLLVVSLAHAEDGWKPVDEGFRMTIPVSWQKQKVHPIDSNCGNIC
jgi:hypothetical protein